MSGKADDDGGLTPAQEDNAGGRQKYRIDIVVFVWKQYNARPGACFCVRAIPASEGVTRIKNNPLAEINCMPARLDPEYMDCVQDLIDHELVKSMGSYIQHGDTDCLRHSINVSYNSYLICKRLGLDYFSAARGGLLHDFFLYDWHSAEKPRSGLHGLIHPRIALQNSGKYFSLNQRERDIILKHMWPLTIVPPKYRETCVVILVDKYCAMREVFSLRSIKSYIRANP